MPLGVKLAALSAIAFVAVTAVAAAQTVPAPSCMRWRAESWARYPGYDHVVMLDNACAMPVDCVVLTDIAPEPLHSSVAPSEHVDLTTFRGSPTRIFTPRVSCTIRAPKKRPPPVE